MLEKTKNEKIEKQDWKVIPAPGKPEPMRYYDVSFQWTANGKPVIFVWGIDLESGNVVPKNEAAIILDKYDDELWKELAEAPTPTPAPTSATAPATAVPTLTETPSPIEAPTLTAVPTPLPTAPVTLAPATPLPVPTKATPKPKPTNETGIEILPPTTPAATPTKAPVVAPTKTAAPPALPQIEFGEEFYQLTGVMTIGGKKSAMLMMNKKNVAGEVGTKFSDGWTITAITANSVTLKKGATSKTVMLKENVKSPTAIPAYDMKSYPKATPKETPGTKAAPGKTTTGGPPKVPAPGGEAPPIPPPPGKTTKKAPSEEPTVIPIN
jgi:hypothetical protein